MKKKNYNPFKMWGSWIGLIFGFLLTLVVKFPSFLDNSSLGRLNNNTIYEMFMEYFPLFIENFTREGLKYIINYSSFIFMFIFLAGGFLIGWISHLSLRD